MSSPSLLLKLSFVVAMALAVVVVTPPADAAISCSAVVGDLRPCLGYLTGSSGTVPPGCCTGIKTLNSAAKTTPDRQAACSCLKNLASSLGSGTVTKAAGLPGKCGVSVGYPISPSTDCSKVK
ncbi:hypothetical protein Nepgr_011865 [Nepenthes gracilis]|uniref:Non-specific lipid-transfer protein n=1 Tax=Nepenthes gracilis TaxID=150966 RepID=A0AAD3SG27_NEPGR|nr:hypothetical protein Nepgr_011865 [Nepenthes gracilis]